MERHKSYHRNAASEWATLAGHSGVARLVDDAADGLSDRDREVLALTYRHGLDATELAEVLGVTLAAATTTIFRLRQFVPAALLSGTTVFIPAPGWLRTRTLNRVRLPDGVQPHPPGASRGSKHC